MPSSIPPTIPIGEYVLRPFRPSDADAWCAYLLDPLVTEHTSWPAISLGVISDLIGRVILDYSSGQSLRWAVARGDNGTLIGSCGYTRLSQSDGVAELAYDLAPAHWGRGVMCAAVPAALAWARGSGFIHHVEALVMTSNARSIAVLERCGFERERLLTGHRLARGIPRDFYLYSAAS